MASRVGPERYDLEGSEQLWRADHAPIGRPSGGERITATVVLRPGRPLPSPEEARNHAANELGIEGFERFYGSEARDARAVADFAEGHGLEVVASLPERWLVVLAGTISQMEAAFGVTLALFGHEGRSLRGFRGPLSLPVTLQGLVRAVFGLGEAPLGRTAQVEAGLAGGFAAPRVAQLYDFPSGFDGSGQCIGLIEMHGDAGGYNPSDLKSYFLDYLKFPQMPDILDVPVGNGANVPPSRAECTLDISVSAAVAPGAKVAVYLSPFESGPGTANLGHYVQTVSAALHDSTNRPGVLSDSFGFQMSGLSVSEVEALEDVLAKSTSLGVTICKASGDDGAYATSATIKFPASSPSVLSCGGTYLTDPGGQRDEVVWNSGGGHATGGGVSETFPLPNWQAKAKVPKALNDYAGRGVPDVAANASPASGYIFYFNGNETMVGGTSAAAPLWAGLVAVLNQALGANLGFLNETLYDMMNSSAFNQITLGHNGREPHEPYPAGEGWNACTGLGTPNGSNLLAALRSSGRGT